MEKLDILPTASHHPFLLWLLEQSVQHDWRVLELMPKLARTWKWTMVSSLLSRWLEPVHNQAVKTAALWEHLKLQHHLQTQAQHDLPPSLQLWILDPSCPALPSGSRLGCTLVRSEILLLHPFFLSLLFTMYLRCLPCCQLWHCSNYRIRISQFNSQEWQRIKSGQVNREREECGNGDRGEGKLERRIAKAFFLWQPDFNLVQWSEVTGGVGITAWATCRHITHLKNSVLILIDCLFDWLMLCHKRAVLWKGYNFQVLSLWALLIQKIHG